MAAAKKRVEARPFERVWRLVTSVPRGRVVTYGQLSEMIDRRLSPIAIAWAMRAAPQDALPWHRVVSANGAISTNGELPGMQRALLEAEGVAFDREGRVDLARFGWSPRRGAKSRARGRSRTD